MFRDNIIHKLGYNFWKKSSQLSADVLSYNKIIWQTTILKSIQAPKYVTSDHKQMHIYQYSEYEYLQCTKKN